MKITINNATLIILLALLVLLWWLCRHSEEPEPPQDEPKTVPYLTADELAAYQWREGKVS